MDADKTALPAGDLILDQIADAVIYADRTGLIRHWNKAAESMFGFSPAEAVGQSLDLIIPERLRAAHWRGFDSAINSGTTRLSGRPTVTRALHKSGDKLYVEMSFALVADAAGVLGSVAVARDVTEKINREKAAAQNAQSAK